jgi:hypothetical protein
MIRHYEYGFGLIAPSTGFERTIAPVEPAPTSIQRLVTAAPLPTRTTTADLSLARLVRQPIAPIAPVVAVPPILSSAAVPISPGPAAPTITPPVMAPTGPAPAVAPGVTPTPTRSYYEEPETPIVNIPPPSALPPVSPAPAEKTARTAALVGGAALLAITLLR